MTTTFALTMPGVDHRIWSHRLTHGLQTVGRGPGVQIRLAHPTVSRRHAQLTWDRGELLLADLASRNGTFLQGRRIRQATLRPGDRIGFGQVLIELAAIPAVGSSDPVSTTIIPRPTDEPREPAAAQALSPAQIRIVQRLIQGQCEKRIAAELDLSPHTVHVHTKRIYKILKVHSRVELITVWQVHATAARGDEHPAPGTL